MTADRKRGLAARLVRPLFAVSAVSLAGLLSVVYVFLGKVTAIKGSYALLGVLVAAVLYQSHGDPERQLHEANHLGRWSTKVTALLAGWAYLITYVTGTRLAAVVVALSVGYSLVAYQLLFAGVTRAVVSQLAVLFTVGPVTKYLATGFYFGATDLLGHVRAVEVLYRTGRFEAIDSVYSTYSSFPALHIVSGTIGAFTGLPAYDSLILFGMVSYTIITVAVYYLSRSLFSPAEAVAVTFVFSTLSVVHNYTTYFFPQALATALMFCLFYVATRQRSASDRYRVSLSAAVVLITVAFAFTHHVTQILFLGIVAVVYAPSALELTRFGRRWLVNAARPRTIPMLFALATGLSHLLLTRRAMIDYFVEFTRERLGDATVGDSGGGRTVIGLGTDIPYQTPRAAIESLVAVDGLYFIALAALFVAGVVTILTHYARYTRAAGALLLGGGAATVVLKTPLLSTVSRLALPLALFFCLIAGIGLWALGVGRGGLAERNVPVRRFALAGLVVVVGVTGPLVAGDDLYGLHAGPNLWETYSTPEPQVDFSEQELAEFEALVGHVDRYDPDVTMLAVSREASERFGEVERSRPTVVSESGIRAASTLAYRTEWTEHQVGYSTDVAGTLYIADWWLRREVDATNKVYTTGSTGVLWEEDPFLSNNRTVIG
jgi:hypothetical protein